MDKKKRLNPE